MTPNTAGNIYLLLSNISKSNLRSQYSNPRQRGEPHRDYRNLFDLYSHPRLEIGG